MGLAQKGLRSNYRIQWVNVNVSTKPEDWSGKLPLMGEPRTYFKATGGHIIVFDPDGCRIADISKERIKIVEWNRSPKGQYFIPTGSDTKFASKEIPDEIKKLWDLEWKYIKA